MALVLRESPEYVSNRPSRRAAGLNAPRPGAYGDPWRTEGQSRCSSTSPSEEHQACARAHWDAVRSRGLQRSEEHTSELQSLRHLVCRLLLEKKNIQSNSHVFEHGCGARGVAVGARMVC